MSALASTPSTRGLSRATSRRSSIVRRSAIARGWPGTPIMPRAVWSAATMNSAPSTVSRSRRGRPASALAMRPGCLDAHRGEGGEAGVVESAHGPSALVCSISSISLSVGMASAHISRPATIAPAALAYSTIRAGGQPASKPWTNAPPKASPAPSPQTTSTGRGGDDRRAVGRGDEHAVAAELDDGDLDAAAEQGVGGLVGAVGADGDAALGAVADGDGRPRRSPRRSPPTPRPRSPTASAGSRGRATVCGRRRAGPRMPAIVERAGSSAIAEPATHSTATSSTVLSSTSPGCSCMSGAAGTR